MPKPIAYTLPKQITIITTLFVVLTLTIVVSGLYIRHNLIEGSALNHARVLAVSLSKMHQLNPSEGRTNLVEDASANHDGQNHSGSAPPGSTLGLQLGREVSHDFSDVNITFYGAYPETRREADKGLTQEFAKRAWDTLQKHPKKEFYEFNTEKPELNLRYARANIVNEACIQCHNNQSDTQEGGWQVGDRRGMWVVNMTLNAAYRESTTLLVEAFAIIVLILCLCFFLCLRMFRDYRKTTSELQQQTEKMQIEIEHRKTAQLAAIANQKTAERANAAKGDFLSIISHELRTPLNAILGFTGILQKHQRSPEENAVLIDRIHTSSHGLLRIINDILDFSKLESGKLALDYHSLDIPSLMNEIISIFFEQARSKNLELHLTLDPNIPDQLYGDATRLRQMLSNIIANAVKFTDKGDISIEVNSVRHDDNGASLSFRVSDTGIGMSAAQTSVIFNPFEQAERGTSRRFGGTGLGLSICQTLVQHMGGTIDVDSEVGKGSSFYWTIICGVDPNTPPPSWKNTPQSNRLLDGDSQTNTAHDIDTIHVLLCEHKVYAQQSLAALFDEMGITFDLAEDSSIVDKQIEDKTFDLIFIDINLPGKNAFEFCQQWQSENTPIIGLVTDKDCDNAENCLLIGMHSYLCEPFTFDDIEKICIACTRRGQADVF